jgi:aspartyl-tRNA(Asn)/glutamyl-tRNA(Gln) amidotransferase subunit C
VLVTLTPEDVRHAAALAHIALEPDELEALARDLAGILDHVGRIASLDLGDVPPTSHALDLVNVLGDDVPRESWPREELLRLAPERTSDGFLVPPIGA